MKRFVLFISALMGPLACEGQTIYVHEPVAAIGACTATSGSSSSGGSSSEGSSSEGSSSGGSSSEGSSSGGSSSEGSSSEGSSSESAPQFECPVIIDGDVEFCLEGYPCRSANFTNVENANASSTLLLYWHGTYDGANVPLTNALPYGMLDAALAANALVVLPIADIEASSRYNNPFPWWNVCGETDPSECDRDDDHVLADLITSCAVDQGLVDPDRLTVSGLSAGAIQTSFLIERGLDAGGLRFSAAVTWSGATPEAFRPTSPASVDTSVFVLHGGPTDVYCGVGQPSGTCIGFEPYAFAPISEEMASDIESAGNFAFVCNHGDGHGASMGPQGTEFLLVADGASPHPWQGFPFGVDGYGQWTAMSGGTNWMLRFYGDCHYPL